MRNGFDILKLLGKGQEGMSLSEMANPNMSSDPEIAGFITKTYEILCNPEFNKIIFWGPSGHEFVIKDINKFEDIVLPKYFRHCKINSFIRQLNMYGFHKSRKDTAKSIFSHPSFQKDRQDLLPFIKRKVRMNRQVLKTPLKKGHNGNHQCSKTKLQTEQKKSKECVEEEGQKIVQLIQSKMRLDSYINLNIPLSIKSFAGSEEHQLMDKDQEAQLSIEYAIPIQQHQNHSDQLINPSMFINSFQQMK